MLISQPKTLEHDREKRNENRKITFTISLIVPRTKLVPRLQENRILGILVVFAESIGV